MLLEFKAKNYKSFKDEFTFSLIPDKKINELSYSILKEKVGRKVYKGLSSAVIYGANASGKSNIISAIHTFQQIILRGNIKNSNLETRDAAAYQLELIPNCKLTNPEPVTFSISFIANNLSITYEIQIQLGMFAAQDFQNRKILFEKLSINDNEIFVRDNAIKVNNLPKNYGNITEHKSAAENTANNSLAENIANNSLNDKELFLTNGFKTIYNRNLAETILNWIENKLIVLYQVDKLQNKIIQPENFEKPVFIPNNFNKLSKIIGTNSNALLFLKNNEKITEYNLYSVINNSDNLISAEAFESYGTFRFLSLFPFLIKVLTKGGTLIIDEFDASLHPMILMNIIKILHDEEINQNKAQLIFNTHNPIFLNANLFRRDEIKFVEKDSSGFSIHYSLSDFNFPKPRNPEEYMNNYFISKYGAIKDIDFSNIFREANNDPIA